MAAISVQLMRAFSCDATQQEVLGLLGQISNWRSLITSAASLRVLPLLYRGLLTRDLLARIDPSYRERLKAEYYRNLGNNIACASLTTRILEVLDSGKVGAVLLKGMAHVYDCYQDFGERVIGDIDLLVKTEELEQASSLLSQAGFAEADAAEPPGPHHHLPPLTDGAGLNFEIHHNLAPARAPVQIDPRKLWDRVRPSRAFKQAFLLDPLDSLIHTSIHLWISSDVAGQLYQLIDIDRLVRTHFSEERNFEPLLDRAAQFAAATPVYRTLSLAAELLKTPVPRQTLETLRQNSSGWKGLRHLARATMAGRDEISAWRYAMYRDILSYRKIVLLKPRGVERGWYLSTRPAAMILDGLRILLPLRLRR